MLSLQNKTSVNMKKISILIFFLAGLLFSQNVSSQVLSESAKRKFTVGVNFYTTIWLSDFVNPDVKTRTVNQGADVFFMYNMPLKKNSLSSFSAGLEIRNENMYTNAVIQDIKADTIVFTPIEGNYNRAKVNNTFVDLPLELKFRTKGGFKATVGFKLGYLIASKQKYVGERPDDNKKVNLKSTKINQLEKFTYGPSLRIGYKWISVYAYYGINTMFKTGFGPKINPISVGLTITPF